MSIFMILLAGYESYVVFEWTYLEYIFVDRCSNLKGSSITTNYVDVFF